MSVLAWMALGLIAGLVASNILSRSGQGLLLDIVLGIVGAVVGGAPVHSHRCDRRHRLQSLQHVGCHRWRHRRALGLSRLQWPITLIQFL